SAGPRIVSISEGGSCRARRARVPASGRASPAGSGTSTPSGSAAVCVPLGGSAPRHSASCCSSSATWARKVVTSSSGSGSCASGVTSTGVTISGMTGTGGSNGLSARCPQPASAAMIVARSAMPCFARCLCVIGVLEESIRSGVTSRAISIHPEVVRVGSILLALALAGCSAQPIELAVSIRTDLAPGTDFTAARVELVPFQSGVTFDPQEAAARSGDHYQQGVLVANFVGIPAGTNRVRAVLLDAAGQEVVARQVELALDESYALTIVLSANCRERSCPGTSEPATYTECLSGRCVEARCGGPDPRGCGDLACTTQADCQLGCL